MQLTRNTMHWEHFWFLQVEADGSHKGRAMHKILPPNSGNIFSDDVRWGLCWYHQCHYGALLVCGGWEVELITSHCWEDDVVQPVLLLDLALVLPRVWWHQEALLWFGPISKMLSKTEVATPYMTLLAIRAIAVGWIKPLRLQRPLDS